jgi:hypothetical protein
MAFRVALIWIDEHKWARGGMGGVSNLHNALRVFGGTASAAFYVQSGKRTKFLRILNLRICNHELLYRNFSLDGYQVFRKVVAHHFA